MFKVFIKNKPDVHLALKQINSKTLKDLSLIIIESQFHLLFDFKNEKIPLLKCDDIFLEKCDKESFPFRLNLVMK